MAGPRWLTALGLGVVLAGLLWGAAAVRGAEPRITLWGTPPKEKPHFGKSAEAVPPLPLPVTPQRRSEKKRPPAPPSLIANLSNFSFQGWQGSPGAVDTLLRTTQQNVNLWYGWEHLDIAEVVRKHTAAVPVRTPILYLCAYYPLGLTADQRETLKDYVVGGGTLLVNCCGQDEAFASVQEELKAMFPKRPLRRLPMDHPIYLSNYRVERVKMASLGPASPFTLDLETPGGADPGSEMPRLRAVTLGTRAAVIVSREDLACGWNQWDNPRVSRYSPTDSARLGINIVTYVTAELRLAKFLSRTLDLEGPNVRPRQQLAFAQIIHDGNWDPNPSGIPFLLKEAASNTSIAVSFERRQFQLRNPDLFAYPLLYLTGTWDPKLGADEVAILRRHLVQGGTLLADAASGRHEFDLALRRLAKELFPDAALQKLPADHPLFRAFYRLEKLSVNHEPRPVAPIVEAVLLGERPVILYSPLGLSDGWAREYSAFARCYTTEDSVRLATNMIVFAMQ
jgi:hypothetical protein